MSQIEGNVNTLGVYLRSLRRSRGLSMGKLAVKINRVPSYLALIELGRRRIGLFDLWRIVEELNGDFPKALRLLCRDAGVPPEALFDAATSRDGRLRNSAIRQEAQCSTEAKSSRR